MFPLETIRDKVQLKLHCNLAGFCFQYTLVSSNRPKIQLSSSKFSFENNGVIRKPLVRLSVILNKKKGIKMMDNRHIDKIIIAAYNAYMKQTWCPHRRK